MTEQERTQIAENIRRVREQMAEAALRAGRRPEEIQLVAATKMNDAERVREALRHGIDAAGENRVQELLDKYEAGAYGDKPLHFIGTLQTNKVKYLIGKTALIQSVGSLKLGQAIAREAEKRGVCQDILLEVNIGREAAKSGLDPDALDETAAILQENPSVRIRGLMAIPPVADESDKNTRYFDRMRQLFIDMAAKKYDNVNMDFLSMGMSGDFTAAIACGSNMVRVGSAIFGPRHY
ncbi:YggS family pyridoxal phosphate-dependent enzyme [Intestinibacillus massiliensis]|uniref:YggS family pyridoxal phosphate-dependent enzyme n=1 Tax=Intestinibacillus massiliensis TaxID=1871029 RepID=UPI000B35E7D3|nr:YggS family pyridoxal phosphate-dependent enzyme [Intestinibacillus massiliensis]